MSGPEFLDARKAEAKDIVVSQMKRIWEVSQIQQIIKDERTVKRERTELVEKLKSLKIMEYLSDQQLHETLHGTHFTKDALRKEIEDTKQLKYLDKNNRNESYQNIDPNLYLPSNQVRHIQDEAAKDARGVLQLLMIEARALKNRLGANTIGKVISVYRNFQLKDQIANFIAIIRESLQSQSKTERFV